MKAKESYKKWMMGGEGAKVCRKGEPTEKKHYSEDDEQEMGIEKVK